MVNYTNSKVYKIWSHKGDKIYIGSTTKQYLSQRMDNHRTGYKSWKNTTDKFVSSYVLFEEYGLAHCFIELLEAKECHSKDELKQLEGKHIREQTCVNKKIEGRTKKEYYDDNKDYLQEKNKQYRENNKSEISQQRKCYRENNKIKLSERQSQIYLCECGVNYTYGHKSRHLKSTQHCQIIESKDSILRDDVK